MTPLPEGSGVTTGTLGPQDTTAWAFASNYQRTFSNSLLNEVRVGQTRRTVARTAAQLTTTAGDALDIPAFRRPRSFPTRCRRSNRRLPAARLADKHRVGLQHERLGSRRHAHVGERAPHAEDGTRLALGAAERDPAAVADRLVHVQPSAAICPNVANTGTPFASFLLGQVQTFSIDLQKSQIQERAHFQEYFFQDEWKVSIV